MECTENFRNCKRRRIDYAESEAILINLREPPSLQDITIVSIAIQLWEKQILIKKHSACNKKRVYENLCLLVLPDSLKLKISNIIEPIGKQYMHCFEKDKLCNSKGLCCWTMEGTIDYRKQFKEIIKTLEFTDVEECRRLYKLACQYCLEDIIPDLELKASLTNDDINSLKQTYDFHIILYWNYLTKNKLQTLLEDLIENDQCYIYDTNLGIYVNMVSSSIACDNIDALKYFWRKLSEEEIITHIDKWTELSITYLKYTYFSCYFYNAETAIVCFLLSNLTSHTKQIAFIKAHAKTILHSLFNSWPYQKFFVPTINALINNFLQEKVYLPIMIIVANKINEKRTTHLLLREVWNLSPLHLKKSFLSYLSREPTGLVRLLEIGDHVTIDMILNYASTSEKKIIVFNIIKEFQLFSFLRKSELDKALVIIERFASKHLPLDSDIVLFKRCIALEYAEKLCLHWMVEGEFQATGNFLNWVFQSNNDIQEFKKNHINPIEIYRKLIYSTDYSPVNNFLKWYFETEEDILNFRRQNADEIKCEECENFLMELCEKGRDGWDQFQRFVSLRFDCSEEVEEFKKIYLNCVASFLKYGAFEFASLFVNWCFGSSDEVDRYKKELLLSKEGVDIFLHDVDDWKFGSQNSKKYILEWFAPLTNEVILKLKSSLAKAKFYKNVVDCNWEEVQVKKRGCFSLLDSFIEKNSMTE